MKSIQKPHPLLRAFATDGKKIALTQGCRIGGKRLSVKLPRKLREGSDYALVALKAGGLEAIEVTTVNWLEPVRPLGGFHVSLGGGILGHSLWDTGFRPKCLDPRGMALVAGAFWMDIYLLGTDGRSRAGVPIADNSTPPKGCERFSWFDAVQVLAAQEKQLPSFAEYVLAAQGVEEGKNAGQDAEKTGHIPGLRGAYGHEQITGTMWQWGSDFDPSGRWSLLFGGCWGSSGAGSRHSNNYFPNYADNLVGARGRCDHLILG